MKYVQPIGEAAGAAYVDAVPASGIEGSAVPAAAIESPMRELEALIVDAGLVPSQAILTQVAAAVRTLLQKNAASVSVAGGTADQITGSYTPTVTALTHGMTLYVRAVSANATTTPQFTPFFGTIPWYTIVKGAQAPLAPGDIAGIGHWLMLQFDAPSSKWVLLNPATGASTQNSTNDPSFADSSGKGASTNWVRGAMSAIATAAGFVLSAGSPGYLKLPSWLGGLIFQWGASVFGTSVTAVTFPIAFPTSAYGVLSVNSTAAAVGLGVSSLSVTGFNGIASVGGNAHYWLALGK